jgi:metallophosphoesterase (TIGR00282 family)
MFKILFIGDVVGKPGRQALREVLPMWKEKYQPDVVIVNVENLAHGKGVTLSTLEEVDRLGVECFTGGNHIFDKMQFAKECFEKYPKLIRPANYPDNLPGHGYYRFSLGDQQILVVNLSGQVFMDKQFAEGEVQNPFTTLDRILTDQGQKGDIIFIDFHAEATSEKVAFGYYVDGRTSVAVGTHTHVPTADARVLPQGTAYVTDVGMTGALNGVIGVKKENVLKKFLNPSEKFVNEMEEDGPTQVNGVLVEVGDTPKAVKIEKLYQET